MKTKAVERFLREPLTHFLLLGGLLLFAADWWAAEIAPLLTPGRIEVGQAERERLGDAWQRQTGRSPTDAELDALLQAWIDEELLFREARRLGLHERDPVVKQRLVQNMRFAEQDAETDDKTLLQAAFALGMAERDPVVRQRLVLLMRHRIESEVHVSQAEAQAYFEARRDTLGSPARYRFEQRFFGEERGEEEATAALADLKAGRRADPGDPFLLGRQLDMNAATIAQRFGPAVARAIAEAPPGEWVGPVASVYGRHLLRVQSIEPAAADYAYKRATAMLFADRERSALRERLSALRSRYRIAVEENPA